MLKSFWNLKLVRFLCVGSTNTLIDLLILNSLVLTFYLPAIIANVISASISIVISYFLNYRVVFRSTEPHGFSQFRNFFLITGVSVLIVQTSAIYFIMHLLRNDGRIVDAVLDLLGVQGMGIGIINLNISKIFAVLLGMVWNFLLYHYVVFRKPIDEVGTSEKAVLPY